MLKAALLAMYSSVLLVGQTLSGSIQGVVTDANTHKPVPASLVMAVRSGLPPFKVLDPAHAGSRQVNSGSYHLAVPRDTALNFRISSHDLKLGDANASRQAFQPGIAARKASRSPCWGCCLDAPATTMPFPDVVS